MLSAGKEVPIRNYIHTVCYVKDTMGTGSRQVGHSVGNEVVKAVKWTWTVFVHVWKVAHGDE